ncbi:MAG TPA: hypothetical protein VFT95_01605, partial [Micromonosporaceae bacterium]|nr:hypothetical protein [Micromonosporaceae bacterium]
GISTLVAPAACSLYEQICTPGEVAIIGATGSSWCEPPREGDRECASGEILVKVEKTGLDHCIKNRYRDGWQERWSG